MKRTVGVNLLYLVPGVVGGTEEYAVRVLRAVAAHRDDDLQLVLFARDSFAATYPDIANAFETRTVALPANRALRVAAESTWLVCCSRLVANWPPESAVQALPPPDPPPKLLGTTVGAAPLIIISAWTAFGTPKAS